MAQYVVQDFRRDLFGHFQILQLRFFDQRADGNLMSRLTNDVDNLYMSQFRGQLSPRDA